MRQPLGTRGARAGAGLSDEDAQALADRLEARGVELSDDCGRELPEPVRYDNTELATITGDTLQLFLRDVRRHPLLTAADEIELAKRIEQGDLQAKERMINSNLRLVVSLAKRYQGQAVAARPDAGGHTRPDPRVGEVRLEARLQVLDLRDLLDPPGIQRGAREPGPHDPYPVHIGQRERKISRAERELALHLGRAPTDAEIAWPPNSDRRG